MLEDPPNTGIEVTGAVHEPCVVGQVLEDPWNCCCNLFGIGGEIARERVDLLGPGLNGAFHAIVSTSGTRPWLQKETSVAFAAATLAMRGGKRLTVFWIALDANADCKSLLQNVLLLRNGDTDVRPFTVIIAVAIVPELFLPGIVALPQTAGEGDGGGGGGARTKPSFPAFAWRKAAGLSCRALRNAPCNSQHCARDANVSECERADLIGVPSTHFVGGLSTHFVGMAACVSAPMSSSSRPFMKLASSFVATMRKLCCAGDS